MTAAADVRRATSGIGWLGPATHPDLVALGLLALYNVAQNTAISERAYVPANLAVTAGLLTLARRSGCSWRDLGVDRTTVGPGLRMGARAGAGAAVALAAAITSEKTRRLLLDDRAVGHTRNGALHRVAIRFPVGTALFEEVAFRGVLDALWRRRHGSRTSTIVSAVSFGLWHLLPTYRLYPEMSVGSSAARRPERILAALGGAVATSVAGVGFSWLRRKSNSIAAPWLAHAAYNGVAYLAARQAWRMQPTDADPLDVQLPGRPFAPT